MKKLNVKFIVRENKKQGFKPFLFVSSRVEPYRIVSSIVLEDELLKLIPNYNIDEDYSVSIDSFYEMIENSSSEFTKNSKKIMKSFLEDTSKEILCTNGSRYKLYHNGDKFCSFQPCDHVGDSFVIDKETGLFEHNSNGGIFAVSN